MGARAIRILPGAWRALDPDGHGRASFSNVCLAAKDLGTICDARVLWDYDTVARAKRRVATASRCTIFDFCNLNLRDLRFEVVRRTRRHPTVEMYKTLHIINGTCT